MEICEVSSTTPAQVMTIIKIVTTAVLAEIVNTQALTVLTFLGMDLEIVTLTEVVVGIMLPYFVNVTISPLLHKVLTGAGPHSIFMILTSSLRPLLSTIPLVVALCHGMLGLLTKA